VSLKYQQYIHVRTGFLTPGAVPSFSYTYLGLSRILDVHFVRCIIIRCCTASLAMEETMVVEGADRVGQGELVYTGILQDNPLLFGSNVSITFSVS
jgi:hypothetical protein